MTVHMIPSLFAAFAFAVSAASGAEGRVWDLASVRIVPADKPSERDNRAVCELASHVEGISGRKPTDGGRFSFRYAKPDDAPTPKPFEGFYRIEGDTVWFWGDTLFATYLFLEKELGVVWAWAGDDGTVLPRSAKIPLSESKTVRWYPPLAKTSFRNYPGRRRIKPGRGKPPKELEVSDEEMRRRYKDRKLWRERHRIADRVKFACGHAFTNWWGRFGAEHPEYFCEIDGERGYTGRFGSPRTMLLCVSNEAVVDRIISEWEAEGCGEYLNVCENDGIYYCQCKSCRQLDAEHPADGNLPSSVTDRYVNFWNRIAAKARLKRPDVKVVTYIYANYRNPPARERFAHPENMLCGIVPSILDNARSDLDAWRGAGLRHFYLRPNYHVYGGAIPRGYEKYIYDDFHYDLSRGLYGVDYDAGPDRYVLALESYVTARMITDPETSFEKICGEFYSAYGAAASAVRRYYERVREVGEKARLGYIALNADHSKLLDDSQLSFTKMFTYGRSEAELAFERDILGSALGDKTLDKVSRRRLEALFVRADHAVHWFRFISAIEDDSLDAVRFGRELVEFRIKNKRFLPDDYGAVFCGYYTGEFRAWQKLGGLDKCMR